MKRSQTSTESHEEEQQQKQQQKQQQQRQAGASSANKTSGKLVFGLNVRTNKLKHDEYAEQRLRAASSVSSPSGCVEATTTTTSEVSKSSSRNKLFNQNNESSTDKKSTSINKSATSLEATSFEQTVDRATASKATTSSVNIPKSRQIESDTNKLDTVGGDSQMPPSEETASSSTRHKEPQRATSGRSRRKSVDRASNEERGEEKSGEQQINKVEQQQQQQQQVVTTNQKRQQQQQFKVLPPPQMSMATTGRASVVSYAKSRIYDKPSKPILSQSPYVFTGCASTSEFEASSLIFSISGDIPQSILSGRKPPKQVNVSKARKEWEGGEPFAKCRSRKRLAAVQRNKNKLLIHESWSMASVVATQQLQFQQALAASQAAHRSPSPQSSDPSVKVLTRGSVLERVQQFERVPSSSASIHSSSASQSSCLLTSSSSSSSILSSSSSGLLSDINDYDDDLHQQQHNRACDSQEASLIINDSNKLIGHSSQPLSPNASKQAAYRYKVASIQQQEATTSSSSSSNSSLSLISTNKTAQSTSCSKSNNNNNYSERQRKLSFKRRLSTASRTGSSTNLIPKFHHPLGAKPNTYELELERRNIEACFERLPERRAHLLGSNAKRHFHSLALACNLSEYYKIPLMLWVRHQLETRPELGDESKLSNILPGYGSLLQRRRSSLAPMNPNNVPTTATGGHHLKATDNLRLNQDHHHQHQEAMVNKQQRSVALIRSNSQQQVVLPKEKLASTTIDNNENQIKQNHLLQKSASIDSGKQKEKQQESIFQYVSCEQFLACWRHLINEAHDASAKFTHLLTLGQRHYLLPDDFVPLVQSIIDDHPGLKFLRAAPDFHMRYIQTVIARIYYSINRDWTGKIKLQELRRSNLLAVLKVLAQEEDINQITDYFSYEHFYVIYCKFWTLDQDHDLLISKEDLARHNDASISSRIIERIFSGIVSRQIAKSGKMSYSDFVWFLIAEEDKKHPRSIEYWFRLMDLDGDGYISMYELEYFYYEQMKRLELMNIEALPFLDTACQILDLINPREKNKISLADLKRTKMATVFFDTFINLEKYLEHESREFVSTRDIIQDGIVISDWDRYASEEYENMVTEESSV